MFRIVLGFLLAGVALATLAGFFAPVVPYLEFANHLRPAIFAASGALLALGLAWRRVMLTPILAVFSLNAALFVLPFAALAPQSSDPGGDHVKVVTFNLLYPNRSVDEIAAFLRAENADVVVLQELSATNAKAIATRLAALYPHVHSCAREVACSQALLSKRPWIEAGHVAREGDVTEMVWARFDGGVGDTFQVRGVHLAWPFQPETQVRHVESLIAVVNAISEPLILAGDLNLTPWSYKLQRLLWNTPLRLNGVLLASWSMAPILTRWDGGLLSWLPPVFLIDHALTTPGFERVSVAIGPNLGSDHRPVVAVLRLIASGD